MISVVIATLNSGRALLPTLSALVAGAVDGLVSEVIVADGGSNDDTALIADVAGCNFMPIAGGTGRRFRQAAEAARAPHLLFLRPGIVLDAGWTGAARRFVERAPPAGGAAVFRRGAPESPERGLLVAREFYVALGGHAEHAADPEADLIRRIGRRRIVTLAAAAHRSILD